MVLCLRHVGMDYLLNNLCQAQSYFHVGIILILHVMIANLFWMFFSELYVNPDVHIL